MLEQNLANKVNTLSNVHTYMAQYYSNFTGSCERNYTQAPWTHQNIREHLEIVPGLVGRNLADLELQVLYGAGGEGLVVPAAVAEGAGNGVTGTGITLTQRQNTLRDQQTLKSSSKSFPYHIVHSDNTTDK